MMKNFFADIDFQRELGQVVELARVHQRLIAPPDDVQLGAMYRFPDSQLPLRWVAVQQHSSMIGYWYLIAIDELPLVGSRDVELFAERENGLLVTRCEIGLWVHEHDVSLHSFLGRLATESVAAILSRLESFDPTTDGERAVDSKAQQQVTTIEHELRLAMDDDAEYRQWLAEWKERVRIIEQRFCSNLVARHEGAEDTRNDLRSVSLATVAENPVDYTQPSMRKIGPSWSKVPFDSLGSLYFRRSVKLIELWYCSKESEMPPSVELVPGVSVDWAASGGGEFRWSKEVLLSDEVVRLSINGKHWSSGRSG